MPLDRHRRESYMTYRGFLIVLFVSACNLLLSSATAETAGIRVQGPGVSPRLTFACCDHGIAPMQSLFTNRDVIGGLVQLHAVIAVPILDLTSERAQLVHRLNEDGIPVVAWVVLSKEEGLYLNADNAAESTARVAKFEQWTTENNLQWTAVGLDIEPNLAELQTLAHHRWRLVATLLRRSLNGARITRARQEYSSIIHELQSRGYLVQTYLMPYMPAERSAHSTLLDRMLGTVDVQANEEYLMLYTSYARPVGAGMIWSLGRNARGIAIGSTDGAAAPGSATGPLDWEEFSRDLIVASHFTRKIGVYDLEGCVRQGFLPRLKDMDWSESVTIPAESIARAERVGKVFRIVLWLSSNLLYFVLAVLLLLISWRVRRHRIAIRSSL